MGKNEAKCLKMVIVLIPDFIESKWDDEPIEMQRKWVRHSWPVLIDMIKFASITNVHIFLAMCVNKTERFANWCVRSWQNGKTKMRGKMLMKAKIVTPFYNWQHNCNDWFEIKRSQTNDNTVVDLSNEESIMLISMLN